MLPDPDLRSNLIDRRISPYLREAHASLLDAASLKGGSRALILDCRDGWAAEEAWRRIGRGQVWGVDVSHNMIELAKRYREIHGRLEFRTWDQRSLPFDDGSFDAVISTFNLHRYPMPQRVLTEAARVLLPGGKILVLEPTKYSFGGLYILVDLLYRFKDPGHVRYYTREQLLSMLIQAGFERPATVNRIERLRVGGKLLANAVLLISRKPQSSGTPFG